MSRFRALPASLEKYEKVRVVIRILRRPASLVTVLAGALLVSACGSGPSQIGSAVVIGDDVVPLDDVQEEIRWALDNVPQAEEAQEQHQLGDHASGVVGSRITHRLVTTAAERHGLDADQEEINTLIEGSGGAEGLAQGAGIHPDRIRDVVADEFLMQELGEYYADRLSVHLTGATVVEESAEETAEEQARDLGEQIAANPDDVVNITRDAGYQLFDEQLDLDETLRQQPQLGISAVFGAREGSVVAIQPDPGQASWLVALVQERTVSSPNPDSDEDADDEDDGKSEDEDGAGAEFGQSLDDVPLDPQVLLEAGRRQLQPLADDLEIRVNPRYGEWDPIVMAPMPDSEENMGYQFQPGDVTS